MAVYVAIALAGVNGGGSGMIELLSRFFVQAAQPRPCRQSVNTLVFASDDSEGFSGSSMDCKVASRSSVFVCREGLQPCPIRPATATIVPFIATFIVADLHRSYLHRLVAEHRGLLESSQRCY
jgi:hypothetical protein